VLSDSISLTAGVRQGGIISPLLFSSYVNSVLTSLEDSKIGCFINGYCANSFLYADDLLLLSISVSDLQILTNKSNSIFKELDLQINSAKSCCLRIGPRFRLNCAPISVNGSNLLWVKELKYLGVFLKEGVNFACNWQPARRKFFIALNSILGTLGSNPSLDVTLSLFISFCIPVLTYGIACFSLSAAEIKSFSFAYNAYFSKIFKSNNANTIAQCQYFCHIFPFYALYYDHIRYSFLLKYYSYSLSQQPNSLNHDDFLEITKLITKYNFLIGDSVLRRKAKIWTLVNSLL